MILPDTDHLSLWQDRDTPVAFALQAHLEASPRMQSQCLWLCLENTQRQRDNTCRQ
jgi:hypothetical protein